jgi:hypothetical protein
VPIATSIAATTPSIGQTLNRARGWLEANEILQTQTEDALGRLPEEQYPNLTVDDLTGGFHLLQTVDIDEWADDCRYGSIERWIGPVQQVFVDMGHTHDTRERNIGVDFLVYSKRIAVER